MNMTNLEQQVLTQVQAINIPHNLLYIILPPPDCTQSLRALFQR